MSLSEEMLDIRKHIESAAKSCGVSKVGYAPLNGIPTRGDILLRGQGMSHAVSMIMEISSAAAYERSKHDSFYEAVVEGRELMDKAAEAVALVLRGRGYRALPVISTYSMDQKAIVGQISHKAVAHQAGLGWIGRNQLLVTPEFGPRIRLMTVITDAELDEGPGPLPNRCGTCRACIDGCPLRALHYSEFIDHTEDRAKVFDFMKCHRQEKAWLERPVPKFCALCISNCPWGRPLVPGSDISYLPPKR
jgi:epoxyqueuosine reductase